MPILHILTRVISGILGATLLYAGLFLHEGEEDDVQNRLVAMWVRVDDLMKKSLSLQARLVATAASVSLTLIERVFGRKAFSWQALRAVFIFGGASNWASMVIGLAFALNALGDMHGAQLGATLFGLSACMVVVLIGLLPAFRSGLFVELVVSLTALFMAWDMFHWMSRVDITLFAGIVLNIFYIAFLRYVLSRVSRSQNLATMVSFLAASLVVALILGSPLFYLAHGSAKAALDIRNQGGTQHAHFESEAGIDWALLFGPITVNSVCALLVFVLIAILAIHRVLWPVLERPLYAMERRKLFANSKILTALGVAALLYAVPAKFTLLTRIVKLFGL